jgi:hypothetical protein
VWIQKTGRETTGDVDMMKGGKRIQRESSEADLSSVDDGEKGKSSRVKRTYTSRETRSCGGAWFRSRRATLNRKISLVLFDKVVR